MPPPSPSTCHTCSAAIDALVRIADVLGVGDEEFSPRRLIASHGGSAHHHQPVSAAAVHRLARHVLEAAEDTVRGLEVSKREQSILSTALEVYARQIGPVVEAATPLLDLSNSSWRPPSAAQVIEWAQYAVAPENNMINSSSATSPFSSPSRTAPPVGVWTPQQHPQPEHIESWFATRVWPQLTRIRAELLPDLHDTQDGGIATSHSRTSSSHMPCSRAAAERCVADVSDLAADLAARTRRMQEQFGELHRTLSAEMSSLRNAVHTFQIQRDCYQDDASSPAAPRPPTETLRDAREIILQASMALQAQQHLSEAERVLLAADDKHNHDDGSNHRRNSSANNTTTTTDAARAHEARMLERAARSRRNAMLAALASEREEIAGRIALLQHEAVALCSEVAGASTCSANNCNSSNNKVMKLMKLMSGSTTPTAAAATTAAGTGVALNTLREQLGQISEALGVAASAVDDRRKMLRALDVVRNDMLQREQQLAGRMQNWGAALGEMARRLLVDVCSNTTRARTSSTAGTATIDELLAALAQPLASHATSSSRTAQLLDTQAECFDRVVAALDTALNQTVMSCRNQKLRMANLADEQRKRGRKLAALAEQVTRVCGNHHHQQQQHLETLIHSKSTSTSAPQQQQLIDAMIDALSGSSNSVNNNGAAAAAAVVVAATRSSVEREPTAASTTSATTAKSKSREPDAEQQQEQQQQEMQLLQRQYGLLCETMRSLILQLDPDNDQLDDDSLDDGAQSALAKFKQTLARLVDDLKSVYHTASAPRSGDPPFELLDGFVSDSVDTALQLTREIGRCLAMSKTNAQQQKQQQKQQSLEEKVDGDKPGAAESSSPPSSSSPLKSTFARFDAILERRNSSNAVYASPPRVVAAVAAAAAAPPHPTSSSSSRTTATVATLQRVGRELHNTFRALVAGTQIKYFLHGSDMLAAAAIAERELEHESGGLFAFLSNDSTNSNSDSEDTEARVLDAAREVTRLSQAFTKGLKLVAILLQKDIDATQTAVAQMLRTALRVDVNSLGCNRDMVTQLRTVCDPAQRHEQRGRYFFWSQHQKTEEQEQEREQQQQQQQQQHPIVPAVRTLDRVFEQVTASCLDWKRRAEESDQMLDSIAFHVCSRISSSAPPSHWTKALGSEDRIQQELPAVVDRLAEEALNGVPLQQAIDLEGTVSGLRAQVAELELQRDTADSAAAVARAQLQQQLAAQERASMDAALLLSPTSIIRQAQLELEREELKQMQRSHQQRQNDQQSVMNKKNDTASAVVTTGPLGEQKVNNSNSSSTALSNHGKASSRLMSSRAASKKPTTTAAAAASSVRKIQVVTPF